MNVLIAVASRHGSTKEIGDRIAVTLRSRGLDVDVMDIDAGRWLDDEHDAYVVGSAVYMDRWVRTARHFVDENRQVLDRHPLWMFSSGPLDDAEHPVTPSTFDQRLTPIEHRTFGGRLARDVLGPVERAVSHLVSAPEGDHRNWREIDEWANAIADRLVGTDHVSGPRRGEGAS